jgi:hypothetical protein
MQLLKICTSSHIVYMEDGRRRRWRTSAVVMAGTSPRRCDVAGSKHWILPGRLGSYRVEKQK